MATRDRYYVGETYGGSRTARGDGSTIEWEWVHTGRAFAQAHPAGRLSGGMWVMLGFVACHALVMAYVVAVLGVYEGLALFTVDMFSLWAMVAKWPAAWGSVWIVLLSCFPFSFPLMMYWADGVRPNLIYRFRFERLIRPQEALADVR